MKDNKMTNVFVENGRVRSTMTTPEEFQKKEYSIQTIQELLVQQSSDPEIQELFKKQRIESKYATVGTSESRTEQIMLRPCLLWQW